AGTLREMWQAPAEPFVREFIQAQRRGAGPSPRPPGEEAGAPPRGGGGGGGPPPQGGLPRAAPGRPAPPPPAGAPPRARAAAAEPAVVTVGSKKFTESVILAHMACSLVREAGGQAVHREQLGGTQFLWQALLAGEIDLYPEYTGTLSKDVFRGRTDLEAALA